MFLCYQSGAVTQHVVIHAANRAILFFYKKFMLADALSRGPALDIVEFAIGEQTSVGREFVEP
jgi:hypothetical protein